MTKEPIVRHDKPLPEGLKAGDAVVLRGVLRTDPAKQRYKQLEQGISMPAKLEARERDMNMPRLKFQMEGGRSAYFWVYHGKAFNHDPFDKVLVPERDVKVTKRQILEHYRSVWPALRQEVVGHQLTVVFYWAGSSGFSTSRNMRVGPKVAKETLEIKLWKDLENIVYNHGIEIIPDLELKEEYGKLRRAAIDVDSKAALEDTKHVVILLYRRLLEIKPKDWGITLRDIEGHVDPKARLRPYIVSTGSKAGFHVRFDIDEPYPAMELKDRIEKDVLWKLWETSDVVQQFCLDPHRRMYPKDPAVRGNKIFLDLSPMKARGGIKAIGSINAKTFAIVQRVPLSQLEAFVPQPDVINKS